MKCAGAHRLMGAEPNATSAELEQHLGECAACSDHRREMVALDEKIHRALKLDTRALKSETFSRPAVCEVPDVKVPGAQRPGSATPARGSQWALAASVLLGVAVVLVLWGALPRHSLAADVVAHVISEPLPADAASPLPHSTLTSVLEQSNLQLDPIAGEITFARTCFFRGRLVPHFVVLTQSGPVTVLILQSEHVKAKERFAESGYSGVLLPDENRGSIAVLSRANVDTEQSAREILSALHARPRV